MEVSLNQLVYKNYILDTKYYYNDIFTKCGYKGKLYHVQLLDETTSYNNINCVGGELVDMISNSILVLELNDDCGDFDTTNIIEMIELQIGGVQIEKLTFNQINIYNGIYGLNVQKIGSKIFYPLPFECMNCGNGIFTSKCQFNSVYVLIQFSEQNHMDKVKNCIVRTNISFWGKKSEYPSKICNLLTWSSLEHDKILNVNFFQNGYYSNEERYKLCQKHFCYINKYCDNYLDWYNKLAKSKTPVIKIYTNQFCGLEQVDTSLSTIKVKTGFYNYVERFFIYFENLDNNKIYNNTQIKFNTIKFIVDEKCVMEYDFDNLLYDNNNLGYKLANGVYEIKWNTIKYKNISAIKSFEVELDGMKYINDENEQISQKIGLAICCQSINFLNYCDGICTKTYKTY